MPLPLLKTMWHAFVDSTTENSARIHIWLGTKQTDRQTKTGVVDIQQCRASQWQSLALRLVAQDYMCTETTWWQQSKNMLSSLWFCNHWIFLSLSSGSNSTMLLLLLLISMCIVSPIIYIQLIYDVEWCILIWCQTLGINTRHARFDLVMLFHVSMHAMHNVLKYMCHVYGVACMYGNHSFPLYPTILDGIDISIAFGANHQPNVHRTPLCGGAHSRYAIVYTTHTYIQTEYIQHNHRPLPPFVVVVPYWLNTRVTTLLTI